MKLQGLLLFFVAGTCLSDLQDRVLMDQDHYTKDHEHNPEYDHEAFLGKDVAKEFDKLSPEESKRRLGIMFHKVDGNEDGVVTEKELKDWIDHIHSKYMNETAEENMKDADENKDGKVTWKEYEKMIYGHLKGDGNEAQNTKDLIARDKRRFIGADRNGDKALNMDELLAFLHPESSDYMRNVLIDETMETIDKDGDGFVSMDEYIGDFFPPEEKDIEPKWIEKERNTFKEVRDKNKDGRLDKIEVGEWILPRDGTDRVTTEVRHLMSEADENKDGRLTETEMVDQYKVFVGSQATDYGNVLEKHDEF